MFRFRQSLAYGEGATGGTTFAQGAFKLKATAGTDRHVFILEREDVTCRYTTFGVRLNRLCVLMLARLVDQARA